MHVKRTGFLDSTRFCDAGSKAIADAAAEATDGAITDRDKAVALFRWVQDEIKYAILHDWTHTATETLRMGRGSCSNKANLLCAMLRAQNIPAGFGVLVVNGKEYFGQGWFPALREMCDETSRHFFGVVHLGGKWLRCDPSDDRALSAGASHINRPSTRIHFDGTAHADMLLDPAHVLSSSWPVPDIDRFLARKTTKPRENFAYMNSYVEFVRLHGSRYAGPRALEEAFHAWRRETIAGAGARGGQRAG
ncbi:transglutaminase-like domain-containing protein [Streptomyces roseoverticillatus]|uniref:transglutaminase-like domain-containing protein n=1 Tax=Streptomyces roseoverticillatus TaxID=66429 RepID=UPI0004C0B888|nr:transglutaminase domain-containing protein [Streptomyces roseoverticillatus]